VSADQPPGAGESRRDAQLSGLMEQLSETEEKNEDLLKSNS